jgi:hypothetical protein
MQDPSHKPPHNLYFYITKDISLLYITPEKNTIVACIALSPDASSWDPTAPKTSEICTVFCKTTPELEEYVSLLHTHRRTLAFARATTLRTFEDVDVCLTSGKLSFSFRPSVHFQYIPQALTGYDIGFALNFTMRFNTRNRVGCKIVSSASESLRAFVRKQTVEAAEVAVSASAAKSAETAWYSFGDVDARGHVKGGLLLYYHNATVTYRTM